MAKFELIFSRFVDNGKTVLVIIRDSRQKYCNAGTVVYIPLDNFTFEEGKKPVKGQVLDVMEAQDVVFKDLMVRDKNNPDVFVAATTEDGIKLKMIDHWIF